MTNHPKDRHVLAVAIKCGAQILVTSNLRDFPRESLSKWDIEAQHPDQFLLHLFDLHPAEILVKLHDQAITIHRALPKLLNTLGAGVPRFASAVASKLGFDL